MTFNGMTRAMGLPTIAYVVAVSFAQPATASFRSGIYQGHQICHTYRCIRGCDRASPAKSDLSRFSGTEEDVFIKIAEEANDRGGLTINTTVLSEGGNVAFFRSTKASELNRYGVSPKGGFFRYDRILSKFCILFQKDKTMLPSDAHPRNLILWLNGEQVLGQSNIDTFLPERGVMHRDCRFTVEKTRDAKIVRKFIRLPSTQLRCGTP
jgi:hypothetical protein